MAKAKSQPGPTVDAENVFDALVYEASARFEAGEAVDLEAIASEHPEHADRLRKLLPTLQAMAELGHSDTALLAASPESPETAELKTGVLGDYRILREVGRGGMGVVYEAEQVSLGRKVALKVLPFAAMLDQKQLQRFQNEARAAASLRHPNIVQVHSVGCERAVHFYAMDYIEGQTLAELIHDLRRLEGSEGEVPEDADKAVSDLADSLASGRFAPAKGSSDQDAPTPAYAHEQTPGATVETAREAQAAVSAERSAKSPAYFRSIAEIGVQVAEALDHAHENGVVHRDVKPSNVILDNSGKPWVTDFGLARIDSDATLTVSGDLLGTVRYMSPEQALAKRIVLDHRTDVYSLGATLYELLTLHPVFSGQDRQELLRQIAFDEPKAPRRLNKAIPAELEIIVTKAMAKNLAERYDTAQELADDLRRFLEDRPIRARRPTLVQRAAKWSRRHKPIVWSAAVSTFLLLVAGLVGLGIGNVIITKERDEKVAALTAETKALAEKNEALTYAEAERRRAEENLDLALAAMDAVYLDAIGRDKLLGESIARPGDVQNPEFDERPPLTDLERELLKRGLDFYDQFARKNADAPRASVQTAQAYYRVGLLQGALGYAAAAVEAYRGAIERFQRLTEEEPENAEHFRHLGEAYRGLGRVDPDWPAAKKALEAGKEACSRAIELCPDDASLFLLRAEIHWMFSDVPGRLADAREAVRLDPDNALGHHWLASTCKTARYQGLDVSDEELLLHAKRAVALSPSTAEYHFQLADAYHEHIATILPERARYERALEHLARAIELDPQHPQAFYERALVYTKMGDEARARAEIAKGARVANKNGWDLLKRAQAHMALREYEKALDSLTEAQRLVPHSSSIHFSRGTTALALGEYELAVESFTTLRAMVPHVKGGWGKRRALAFFHLGEYENALADLRKFRAERPSDTSALWWIPPALVANCPDESFKEGLLELADEAVENSPNRGAALNSRATLYLGLGEWNKARADLKEAVESEDASHHVHYQHALLRLVLEEAEKYRDACAAMVRKFGEADDPMAVNCVAWTCALAPNAVDDYEPVLACTAKAVEARPASGQFLNTLGAVLYRIGQDENAIKWLTELDRSRENPDAEASSSPAYTWYFLAMAHHKAGNTDQAREYVNKANQWTDGVLADQEDPLPWDRRATLELLRKEAKSLLAEPTGERERSDQANPQRSNETTLSLSGPLQWILHSRRARRFAAEENWTEAASALSESLKLRPDDWELWKSLGEVHEKLNRWDDALADYQKAIELEPDEWDSWKTLGKRLAESGQREKAVLLYTSLLKHNSDNGELWQARTATLLELGLWDKAMVAADEALRLDPTHFYAYAARAQAYAEMGDYSRAIADCDEAIRLSPTNWFPYAQRAKAQGSLGNYNKAIADYDEAIRLDGTQSWPYSQRAEACSALGRYDEALADWDRYVQLGHDDAPAALIRAQMLLIADRVEESRQACVRILDRFGQSEHPGEYVHAARACLLAPKAISDPMVPVELAGRAVSSNPSGATLYILGMAHLRAGQLDEAEQRFQESLETDPDWDASFLNWLGLALVHHERGEMEEGRQWLRKAVESMEQHPVRSTQGRIEGQLLRREVEQLLAKPEEAKDDAESGSEE